MSVSNKLFGSSFNGANPNSMCISNSGSEELRILLHEPSVHDVRMACPPAANQFCCSWNYEQMTNHPTDKSINNLATGATCPAIMLPRCIAGAEIETEHWDFDVGAKSEQQQKDKTKNVVPKGESLLCNCVCFETICLHAACVAFSCSWAVRTLLSQRCHCRRRQH